MLHSPAEGVHPAAEMLIWTLWYSIGTARCSIRIGQILRSDRQGVHLTALMEHFPSEGVHSVRQMGYLADPDGASDGTNGPLAAANGLLDGSWPYSVWVLQGGTGSGGSGGGLVVLVGAHVTSVKRSTEFVVARL